jgi:hypothetical protein
MIAFACGLLIVTCSLFGFNAIIVLKAHLFELTFAFSPSPIFKYNQLTFQAMCQAGVISQTLDGCCLLICGFDNFKQVFVVLQVESVFLLVSIL